VSLELTPANLNDWRTVATGSAAGTNVAGTPVYGCVLDRVRQRRGHTHDRGDSRAVHDRLPDADAGGGAVTITAVGMPVLPTGGGAPLTVTVVNTVATY